MFLTGVRAIEFIWLKTVGDTLIILFGGGTKSKQQKDIDKAKNLHAEYKQRKKTG